MRYKRYLTAGKRNKIACLHIMRVDDIGLGFLYYSADL